MTPVQTRTRPPAHRRSGTATITVTVEIPADDPRLARRLTAALGVLAQGGGRVAVSGEGAPVVPAEPAAPEPAAAPALVIDVAGREVTIRGEAVALTRLEFDLLAFLARHPGMVHTRPELLRYVWETPDTGLPGRTVDVHVRRLRAKLAEFDALVATVRGVGYRFTRSRDVEYRAAPGYADLDRVLSI
ncbi:winged helix-turn-helix domain-containing protein [Glycomyces terrestris]|uniref:Winged helix family transcriptional regulator n=1 Tax=Glycomyces terrestris TaxID=2493553 RepID=A0A426UVY7_9ACTN|nr:winged helix-turn-helix domain-containing protein [Glycomyces terrestris]RRR98423.1 winged helix family transcriptional regulator [Glycomyces terrestris]